MIITLTHDAALARVQLAADVIVGRKTVTVERSTNELLWETVRGGLAVPVSANTIALDDYEYVPGVNNFYRFTPADPYWDFEAGVAGWEPVGGTLTSSTVQAHNSTSSALLTPDGVSANARATLTLAAALPVAVGVSYTYDVWVYSPVGYDVDLSVQFLDTSNTQVEFVVWGTAVTVPPGVWTRITRTRTAPTNAVKAILFINERNTPAASKTLHIDDVTFTGVVYPPESANIVPAHTDIWLKSIRYPFLNRKIVVTEFSDPTRAARAGVFDVKGRSAPVAVTDLRAAPQFTLTVRTDTLAAARDLDLMLASGGPMFLHLPAGCPVPGGYVAIGDITQARRLRSASSPRRYTELPCTVITPPGPDVTGATMTWGAVLNLYGSWTALLGANPTWADLLANVASPDDLVAL